MTAALRATPEILPNDSGNPSADESGPWPLESGIQEVPPPMSENGADANLYQLQDRFIENWGSMANAFAMDRTMGRIHALIYVSVEPVSAPTIALRLAMTEEAVQPHLDLLADWGLITEEDYLHDGVPHYTAELDPWAWFLRTIRERRRRELIPVQDAVRSVAAQAQLLKSGNANARETFERIERFTKFIEDFSKLIDAFVTLGAGPMMKVLRTFAKLMPRSSLGT